MALKTVSVPKYRHHKGTGQAFVQVSGRRYYLGKWNSPRSKERYAAFIAQLAVSPASAPSLPLTTPAQLTIVELAAAYLDFADGYYRKDGQLTRSIEVARVAIRVLNRLYGQVPAADFGPLRLLAIQSALTDNHARGYVNKLVGCIKRIFKWGVSRQMVPPSVHTSLSTVEGLRKGRTTAREPEPIGPVADDVVEATLPRLPVVVADMVRFQRLTGARPGEVFQVRPCDIDQSGEIWQYRPISHKTDHHGRERIIYIGPKAQQVLLPYLLRDAQTPCFQPAESERKRHEAMRARRRTRVQPSQWKRRKTQPKCRHRTTYNRSSYAHAIRRAVEKANAQRLKEAAQQGVEAVLLPQWSPNQLRHSKATEVRRQFGLEAAQVSLGHAKADVTQVYAERDARLAVEVARKIG